MVKRASSIDAIKWTNPSVLKLSEDKDPVEFILGRVRRQAFDAMEEGWSGPPYDPIRLAERTGVEVIPIEEVEDARLVHHGRRPRIEFNPNRNPERVRFSIAHELGHLAFPDAAEKIRNRAHGKDREGDDWQIELLCNLAAAELLMPTGSFPELGDQISLEHLIHLAASYRVSVEAALLRAVRMTARPACAFTAARNGEGREFRLEYLSPSRGWVIAVPAGAIIGADALARCTAVGSSAKGETEIDGKTLRLECVGAPPYPHTRYPRVVGLLRPLTASPEASGITFLHGDATEPPGEGEKVIVHVVNDKALSWGGHGFAPQLRSLYPEAQASFTEWAKGAQGPELGALHIATAAEGLSIASLVAQHSYGSRAAKIPLRYGALEVGLMRLREHLEAHPASVHMPRIGTGQAGGEWQVVEELTIRHLLAVAAVTVYLPPGAEVPGLALEERQLDLLA